MAATFDGPRRSTGLRRLRVMVGLEVLTRVLTRAELAGFAPAVAAAAREPGPSSRRDIRQRAAAGGAPGPQSAECCR